MPKFSVILPVHNVEKYLDECLKSIVNQSLKDIEIICINDGSTDNSLEILNKYAQKDNRFVIFSQKNQGQGAARNKGIELATGEYIAFVDPDDWIDLDMLEILYTNFQTYLTDIVQFDCLQFYDGNKRKKEKEISLLEIAYQKFNYDLIKNRFFSWKDFKDGLFHIPLALWNKVYSREFLNKNNLRIPNASIAEDVAFSVFCLLSTDKVCYVDIPFYHYRIRAGSTIHQASDKNFCLFDIIEYLTDFLNKKNLYTELKEDFEKYKFDVLYYGFSRIPKESAKLYLEKCKTVLTPKYYQQIGKDRFSFLENIFCVKNRTEHGKTYKIVRFLGLNFKLKRII